MNPTIAIPLPDGQWLALEREEFQAARLRAQELGLAPAGVTPAPAPERLLTSRELAALTGLADTTLEGMAARGEIPSLRLGRALRFLASEVTAAVRVRR